MKIGMNMLLWTTFVDESFHPILEDLAQVGYDGVEIPLGEGDETFYRQLSSKLDELGLGRTSVTSLMDDTNPVSPDPAVRRKAVEEMKQRIDVGAVLGSEVIGGPFHSAFASFTGQPPTMDEKRWSIQVMRAAAEHAEQYDIVLTPEALNRFECYLFNTLDDISFLIQEVDHPNLQMIYDTHHANIEEKDPAATIKKHAAHIKHVHISENDRGTPGNGQVHWDDTFKTLHEVGYDGWLTIEAFSRHNPEFASGIGVWRNFESTTEEIYRDGFDFIQKMWNKYSG